MAVSGIKIICIDTDEVTVEIDPYLIETKSREEVAQMVHQAISERLDRIGVNRKFRRAEERSNNEGSVRRIKRCIKNREHIGGCKDESIVQ